MSEDLSIAVLDVKIGGGVATCRTGDVAVWIRQGEAPNLKKKATFRATGVEFPWSTPLAHRIPVLPGERFYIVVRVKIDGDEREWGYDLSALPTENRHYWGNLYPVEKATSVDDDSAGLVPTGPEDSRSMQPQVLGRVQFLADDDEFKVVPHDLVVQNQDPEVDPRFNYVWGWVETAQPDPGADRYVTDAVYMQAVNPPAHMKPIQPNHWIDTENPRIPVNGSVWLYFMVRFVDEDGEPAYWHFWSRGLTPQVDGESPFDPEIVRSAGTTDRGPRQ